MTSALTSDRGTEKAIAQYSDDPFIALLTISHPSFDEPLYFARNRKAIVSNGKTFKAAYFELELAGDGTTAPSMRITVSNVHRSIGRTLEKLPSDDQCECRIDLVLASTPDTIERSWTQFVLQDAVWDAMTVQVTIGRVSHFDEPFPFKRITTDKFRGISPDA